MQIIALTVIADSRVLIEDNEVKEESHKKCSVASDELLFNGVLTAKTQIENQKHIKLDSIRIIQSKDNQSSCMFVFELYRKNKHLGQAEIILSKNSWRVVSRKFVDANNESILRW